MSIEFGIYCFPFALSLNLSLSGSTGLAYGNCYGFILVITISFIISVGFDWQKNCMWLFILNVKSYSIISE